MLLKKLQKTYLNSIIDDLLTEINSKCPYVVSHQFRVAELSVAIAMEMSFYEKQMEAICLAAIFHDIGKILVPAEILNKPDTLSDLEFSFIETHPQKGYDMLKTIPFNMPVAKIVLQHHESVDGSGYPLGLRDGEVLMETKVLSVADSIDAMCTKRPYRPSLSMEMALEEITKLAGIQYDHNVVKACVKLFSRSSLHSKIGEPSRG